jgi:hypothetical protein
VTALSRVSVPISPRHQRHLAFISEFNVQMLYLPGLKNVVADFLSCLPPPPTPYPLESAETVTALVARIQSISKLWPLSKIAAQKRSAFLAVHLSNLPFARQAPSAWLTIFQKVFFTHLSQKN